MLLLHGFTGTALAWSQQLESWARDHRVIAPDLLGHGASEAPADPAAYALERQADSLAELLDRLDASPAIVVGYSMGARLALVLALEHPAHVERLVLESPSPGIADPADRAARREADDRLAQSIERDGVEAFVARWEAMPVFASHAGLPDAVLERQRSERRRHSVAGLAGSLRGAGQGVMTPLHARLPAIRVPALVVTGSLDEAGRERASIVARGLSDGRRATIDGAGHTPHLEQPDEFLRVTNEFLSASHVTA
jgi:2-succinyl-6-hydroxy-2,4-cyclohexadiene-1-carboxylate synthase